LANDDNFHFIRPVAPNNPELSPFDYRICWEMHQQLRSRRKLMVLVNWSSVSSAVWHVAWSKVWSMTQ